MACKRVPAILFKRLVMQNSSRGQCFVSARHVFPRAVKVSREYPRGENVTVIDMYVESWVSWLGEFILFNEAREEIFSSYL